MGKLRLGLVLPTGEGWLGRGRTARWTELRELARLAEAVGFDALWVADHLLFRDSPRMLAPLGENRGIWEAWTLLGALAAATERVTLGPFVTPTGFRNPALLAKLADTLDEVAGGRLVLGLGAGSRPPEYAAFGYPYGALVSRFAEALAIVVPLLRTGRVDFQGRYYAARDCELRPRGPRPHGPPILIGGHGARVLGLAARWADRYNTAWHERPEPMVERFAAVAAACRAVGRDPATLGRTCGVFVALPGLATGATGMRENPVGGSLDEIAERLHALHLAGAEELMLFLDPRDRHGVERFAGVVERLWRLVGG